MRSPQACSQRSDTCRIGRAIVLLVCGWLSTLAAADLGDKSPPSDVELLAEAKAHVASGQPIDEQVGWMGIEHRKGHDTPYILAPRLHRAVYFGCIDTVKYILSRDSSDEHVNNANCDVKGSYRAQVPLAIAAMQGHQDIAQLLLLKDADIDAEGLNGRTAVWCAVYAGHNDLAKWLVERGAKLNPSRRENSFPLVIAAEQGNTEMIEYLLANGSRATNLQDRYDGSPVEKALANGHIAAAALILHAGGSVQASSEGAVGPLSLACRVGDLSLVRMLLSRRASVNHVDGDFTCPLMEAAMGPTDRHRTIVELLLEQRAEVNVTLGNGKATPLHNAALGNNGVTALLIKAGANVTATDRGGRTPLHVLAGTEHFGDEIAMMLQAGAEINAQDNVGNTPLHYAVLRGCYGPIQSLIRAGANYQVKNKEGKTAIQMTSAQNIRELVQREIEARQRQD